LNGFASILRRSAARQQQDDGTNGMSDVHGATSHIGALPANAKHPIPGQSPKGNVGKFRFV
jgi:hypothetical protein